MTQASDQRAIYPSLKGKRVLITGGGSGIGEGIVEGFAHQGSEVTFFDISANSQAVAERTGAKFVDINLTNIGAVKQAVLDNGPFDVLVNNAANDDRHDIEAVTEEYWDDRMDVNLKHLFFCTQAAVKGMKERGGGSIINLGSISWHLALPDLALYQTAKAAIEGLTRSLARDLGRDKIRVNCVVPGNVRTERQLQWYTPEGEQEIVDAQCMSGRLMPEDVAALVMFLAADDSKLMTGHEYFVDAGWR
ncbi:SDR family oxidoreductase [Sphingomonas piscis]|uniref:SDR family oxidoreductase n=1 Tax=Sphingomonas piscis TaxID=2714943 RepID=A0A6G7YN66_9SPHN|nr:SDR family oxidoreductase [Sphingomonas piscis]QIK78190.1 SDR family oxidoreductase [Sphingomonas piscis]